MSDPAVTTVFVARTVVTMDAGRSVAQAVAVREGRIVAVGSLDDVRAACPDAVEDTTFADAVVLPGLIDQHVHPLLGATTLMTDVIAPEAWVLPHHTFPAASDADAYDSRLADAHAALPAGDWLFSWGFHHLWHGAMSRARLDRIVGDRPTAIWQRSCHEWYLNTAALDAIGMDAEVVARARVGADMVDLDRGHFWENGWMVVLAPLLMPRFLTEERFRGGLHQLVAYLHMNGVTAINEPGIAWEVEPFGLYQEILGASDVPFTSTFLVDGRTQSVRRLDEAAMLADAESQVARAPEGKVRMVDRQVKLFADGAIISLLMQMKDGYVDASGEVDPNHVGEWIMEPADLRRSFDAYWDAGWQVHIHVNGDLGLEVLLDVIEDAQRRRPRDDHRTVVVHFANSTEEQVARIAALGAIVSANPYYPIGFADKYAQVGLGPDRADVMVRAASVVRNGVPLSFHSDLPMGPSDPLAMVAFAVNRTTPSGRVAGPEQRIDVDDALAAVTIGAAYSWQAEDEIGSIEVGKQAVFTVVSDDPHAVDPTDLLGIRVLGTVYAGGWYPVSQEQQDVRLDGLALLMASGSSGESHTECCGHACGCEVARFVAEHVRRHLAA